MRGYDSRSTHDRIQNQLSSFLSYASSSSFRSVSSIDNNNDNKRQEDNPARTHPPKPSTPQERTTARTTRYTPTCGPNRGSLRMTSWRGGSCSRLPAFRFNVGIRGLCLCLRRHLSICRFVEFAIVGIWIGEKGEREMKSISYPKCSASRYTSPPQTERRRSNRCWRVRQSEQDHKRRLCTHNHRTQPYTSSYS
jgi:hypothetical protein